MLLVIALFACIRLVTSQEILGERIGNSAPEDGLGFSVAIYGDTVIAGAPFADNETGAALILERNGSGWMEAQRIQETIEDAQGGRFGFSVSVYEDLALVGAPAAGFPSSGAAFLFRRQEQWELEKKLIASDATSGDKFGGAVKVFGNTLLVGAHQKRTVYVFTRNTSGSNEWGELRRLTADAEWFGYTVDMNSAFIVSSTFRADEERGAAFVFARDSGEQLQKITAPDGSDGDWFGFHCRISSENLLVSSINDNSAYLFAHDGKGGFPFVSKFSSNETQFFGTNVAVTDQNALVAGYSNVENKSGIVHVFHREREAWVEDSRMLIVPESLESELGIEIAVSPIGEDLILGAWRDDVSGNNAGALFLFEEFDRDSRVDVPDNETIVPTSSPVANLTNETTVPTSSPIRNVTNTTMVPTSSPVGNVTNETMVPTSSPIGNVTNETMVPTSSPVGNVTNETMVPTMPSVPVNRTMSPSAAPTASPTLNGIVQFRESMSSEVVVSLFDDIALFGSPEGVVLFERTDETWNVVRELNSSGLEDGNMFGFSLALTRNAAIVGAPGSASANGSAIVFARDSGGRDNWGEIALLEGHSASFGSSSDVHGDFAVVGQPSEGSIEDTSSPGSAFIFSKYSGDGWGLIKELMPSRRLSGDQFGFSVALDDDIVVVGAPRMGNFGSAYVYARNSGGPNAFGEIRKLEASGGFAVDVSGDHILVGDLGAAYIYARNQGGADQWGGVTELLPTFPTQGFGTSLSLSGDAAAVGGLPSDGTQIGSVAVFTRNQGGVGNWGEVNRLFVPFPAEFFGTSISLDEDRLLVGVDLDGSNGTALLFLDATTPPNLARPDDNGQPSTATETIPLVTFMLVSVAFINHQNK